MVDVGQPDSLVQVELDVASFATGNARRDATVRGAAYLDVARHPTMTFEGSAADPVTVAGSLTVRGVSVPVDLRVADLVSGREGFTATATGRVDRYAFGVPAAAASPPATSASRCTSTPSANSRAT